MKAKCNKNLFMNSGKKCFTKGKTYEVYELGDEYFKCLDDQKALHSIWDLKNVPDTWYQYFTLISEMSNS